eukprot:gene977-1305_t
MGDRSIVMAGLKPTRTIFDGTLDPIVDLAKLVVANQRLTTECGVIQYGKGWGEHYLCEVKPATSPCYFYSFGISVDYSFDQDVANRTGCYGFAADPTVAHKALLPETKDRVIFNYLAAKSYHDNDNKRWKFYTSVPGLRRWQNHSRVEVLKMDCEGCEYSLARDILQEDPTFFDHIGQFAVEVHYSKLWMKGKEELYGMASLLQLLRASGMQLIESRVT